MSYEESIAPRISFKIWRIKVSRVSRAWRRKVAYPKIRSEVHRGVGSGHLGRLVLKVGSAVNQLTDLRVIVKLAEELAGFLVVADLSKLEGNSARAVLRTTSLTDGVANGVKDCSGGLTSGLTVGDADDEQRLAHLSATQTAEEDSVNDLLAKFSTHWGEAAELMS